MKTVAKYDNAFSANIAKGMLQEAGIEAFILNENLGYTTAVINQDLLAIELVVDDSDYLEASKLLAASHKAE